MITEEEKRLEDANQNNATWRRWGPYLSERQWSTVREDYSPDGNAWDFFPHDHARSRAYRWGEDGIAGISDDKQQLCFALAFWNGKDPILKERLFGLTSDEGNHGEDVKEYYFYLDNTPSHCYMKHLYKYPQKEYPYEDLIQTNRNRGRLQPEYELMDTGIFDDNRYFDIFTEYAKTTPEEILIRCTAFNRGPDTATLHLLPTIWFRNIWSWEGIEDRPSLSLVDAQTISIKHPKLEERRLYCQGQPKILFTENNTNNERLFNIPSESPYVKDAFHDYVVSNRADKVNPANQGTKAAAYYAFDVKPGESVEIKLRLSDQISLANPFGSDFDQTFSQRKSETDAFYAKICPFNITEDMRNIQRQAFAGLLWNKQCYHFNVNKWLKGDPSQPPPPPERLKGRNHHWPYFDAHDILSVPDKWEYPWFAAWDLAFHTIVLAMIDPAFAKRQLLTLTYEWYMSPDGKLPAYEWSFGDTNPPVHAWAALRVYQIERKNYGKADRVFLETIFQKMLINFTCWVNLKDKNGCNIFEGGFLGLDNIGAFNRTLGPPEGGILEQTDATGWMGMYCLNLMQIALELAEHNPAYDGMASKFFEHFVYISEAINNITGQTEGLWNEDAGFYYSIIIEPNEQKLTLREDSLLGIIPLLAVAPNHMQILNHCPMYKHRIQWLKQAHPDIINKIANHEGSGTSDRIMLSFADREKLVKILAKVLSEDQFLSPYGIRSVSKKHLHEPFSIVLKGIEYKVDYEPAESTNGLYGGNSNWRGPIWFPINYLFIEALQKYHYYFGDDLKVECPTGSGKFITLWDLSLDLNYRLLSIFLKDEKGRRPLYGNIDKFQNDPHWKDYIHFHEYFNGDNGFGLGASNQTGWTSLVAKLIQQYGQYAKM